MACVYLVLNNVLTVQVDVIVLDKLHEPLNDAVLINLAIVLVTLKNGLLKQLLALKERIHGKLIVIICGGFELLEFIFDRRYNLSILNLFLTDLQWFLLCL